MRLLWIRTTRGDFLLLFSAREYTNDVFSLFLSKLQPS